VENITSSKLFTTRQGTIMLGVIAAVIAAIALIVYLNNYRNSHGSGAAISVLVAQKLIQKGTPGDVIRQTGGLYQVSSIPKNQVESGAVVDPATLSGLVATTDISPGQQLTTADFGPAANNSVINQLGRGQRAVVIPLGSPAQVGGQIAAGSHVDVWVSLSAAASGGSTRQITRELYEDMYVLGVNGGNVTFRATPAQAGTLIYASQNSTVYLTLRPTVGSMTKPPVISSNNLGH
jgi:Flp pilus assembly protein CpaB